MTAHLSNNRQFASIKAAAYRFNYFQDDENIPLVPIPERLHFSSNGAHIIYTEPRTATSPRGEDLPMPGIEHQIFCPTADVILTEYIQKAFPIKNTVRWMEYGREKSRSKTGSTDEQGYEIGLSVDLGEMLKKSFDGQADAKWAQKWQQAYSYHIEQGKKYQLAIRLGKLTEEYQTKLTGIEFSFKQEKMKTTVENANGWLKKINGYMDERLDEHFKWLLEITGK